MTYNVFTDGSCNQGSKDIQTNGGWAFIIADENNSILIKDSDFEPNTTNNRCEMLAIIKSIECIKKNENISTTDNDLIIVNCDSAYIVNAFEDGWIEKWMKNGWKNSKGEDVLNQDYWNIIIEEKKSLQLKFNKVKRRVHPFAKKVDAMAREKMRS